MKHIFFVRHAKSSWSDSSLADVDRPLNKRGINDVGIISRAMLDKKICPDRIICSPSNRTRMTAKGIIGNMNWSSDLLFIEDRMYHAYYYEVLDIIRKVDNKVNKLMLFGHNPSITNFANKFSEEYIDNIPTLGVVEIKCDIKEWKDLTQRNSVLVDSFYPKMYK